MDHPQKLQALADIRGHLRQHGSKNWGTLRTRLNFVGAATFWRWIREAKAQTAPELIARYGLRRVGEPRLDFLSEYHCLWADAMKLRTHALRSDGNPRHPALLDRAIRIRIKLLRQGLDLEARIYSADAQRAFYDGLMAEIAKESPAVQRRLIERLRAFNRGFDEQRSNRPVNIPP
jgi:hypothetical protein